MFVPANLDPAPSFRLWRAAVTVEELTATVARYLGEERARASLEAFADQPPHASAAVGACRFRAAAPRRAAARLGDRRRLVAARALASAAQAHGVDQGRAQAARRRQCGDPLQPRDPADRARSRRPGHRRVRQGRPSHLLEPAVRRNPRAAGRDDAGRHRSCRDPALQRRARRLRPGRYRGPRRRTPAALRRRPAGVSRTVSRPRPRHRGPPRPDARRRHGDDVDRHHPERRRRRGAGERQ